MSRRQFEHDALAEAATILGRTVEITFRIQYYAPPWLRSLNVVEAVQNSLVAEVAKLENNPIVVRIAAIGCRAIEVARGVASQTASRMAPIASCLECVQDALLAGWRHLLHGAAAEVGHAAIEVAARLSNPVEISRGVADQWCGRPLAVRPARECIQCGLLASRIKPEYRSAPEISAV